MLNLVAVARGSWMDTPLFSRQTLEAARAPQIPPAGTGSVGAASFKDTREAAIDRQAMQRLEDPERWDGLG